MKVSLVIVILLFQAVASCNNPTVEKQPQLETPKALKDKDFSYETVSRRGYDDLVESLYKELAEKTPELKELESRLEQLSKSKADSLAAFDNYSAKNTAFYNSATYHAGQIKDSLLRQKIRGMLTKSLTQHHSTISQHQDILRAINAKELQLDDLHTVLKITKTLPLITQYQKDNLPAIKSLKGFYKQLNATTAYTDTLTKN